VGLLRCGLEPRRGGRAPSPTLSPEASFRTFLHASARDSSRCVGGSKTPCSRRGAGTQRRQAAFTPRRLRAFASSRAVPFNPAFTSREAAKAAKSCRGGASPLSTLSARFIPFRGRQQSTVLAHRRNRTSPSPLRGFEASRLFRFLPQRTGQRCRTRTPRDREPGAEHRQTIAHSVSCGFTSALAPSPGGAAEPQARPCPLKPDSEPSSTPQRETHPVPWAAAKHFARAEAQGRREDSPPSILLGSRSQEFSTYTGGHHLDPYGSPHRLLHRRTQSRSSTAKWTTQHRNLTDQEGNFTHHHAKQPINPSSFDPPDNNDGDSQP
jgi:hypothetical protein